MKLSVLIWIMLGTTLAGVFVTALLTMPQFADQLARLIPIAAGAGYAVAIPLSVMIARRIEAATRRA